MKGIAVPYIIAIILGVVVVGLIGYFFVTQGFKIPGVATKAECESKQLQWCSRWQLSGYQGVPDPLILGVSCKEPDCKADDIELVWKAYSPGCGSFGVSRPTTGTICQSLSGGTLTGGGETPKTPETPGGTPGGSIGACGGGSCTAGSQRECTDDKGQKATQYCSLAGAAWCNVGVPKQECDKP